jgi:hypothetical protein
MIKYILNLFRKKREFTFAERNFYSQIVVASKK